MASSSKKKRVSLCEITATIWIGDIVAAASVAAGHNRVRCSKTRVDDKDVFSAIEEVSGHQQRRAHFTVVAVLNASGCEANGLTLENDYHKLGIGYETISDPNTGITLGDAGIRDIRVEGTADYIASRMVKEGTDGRDVHVRGAMFYPVHVTSPEVIRHFLYVAASKIQTLHDRYVRRPGDVVLVHCHAGRNRSAAAIVAHLVVLEGYSVDDAISRVSKKCWQYREERVLTNKIFIEVLKTLPNTHPDIARQEYVRFCADLEQRLMWHRKQSQKSAVGGNSSSIARITTTTLDDLLKMRKHMRRDACCVVCGATPFVIYHCGKCKSVFYCSRECQADDWKHGHKELCC